LLWLGRNREGLVWINTTCRELSQNTTPGTFSMPKLARKIWKHFRTSIIFLGPSPTIWHHFVKPVRTYLVICEKGSNTENRIGTDRYTCSDQMGMFIEQFPRGVCTISSDNPPGTSFGPNMKGEHRTGDRSIMFSQGDDSSLDLCRYFARGSSYVGDRTSFAGICNHGENTTMAGVRQLGDLPVIRPSRRKCHINRSVLASELRRAERRLVQSKMKRSGSKRKRPTNRH
jgi:hypothetical protein